MVMDKDNNSEIVKSTTELPIIKLYDIKIAKNITKLARKLIREHPEMHNKDMVSMSDMFATDTPFGPGDDILIVGTKKDNSIVSNMDQVFFNNKKEQSIEEKYGWNIL